MSVKIQGTYVTTYREFVDRISEIRSDYERRIAIARQEAAREAELAAKREADKARAEMEKRINRATKATNERIKKIDEDNRRRINDLAKEVYSAIDDLGNELWKGIDDVNQRLDRVIDDVNQRFDAQDQRITDMEASIQGIYDYIADRQERGRQAVKDALTLYDEYMRKYPIQKYLPGEAQDINIRVRNISSQPEAAEGQALEIMTRLYVAAERAAALEAAHIKVREATDAMIKQVLSLVNDNRTFKYDDEGDVVKIESNFWSHGRYDEIIGELNKLQAEIAGDPSNERLDAMRKRVAELEEEAAALRNDAIEKSVMSEARLTMAEDLVSAYISQGYQVKLNPQTHLDEVGYMGGETDSDWREGVFAIVTGPVGEEITITIEPDDATGANRVLFHRNDTRPVTEAEYIESIKRICEITRRAGYKVGDVSAPKDCDHKQMPELGNGENIKRKGTADKIRKQI